MPFKSEQRRYPRYEYSAEVKVGGPGSGNERVIGSIVNVSMGGCLIRFYEATIFEDDMAVEACLRGYHVVFRAMGVVRRRSERGYLIGISFTHLSDRGQIDLKELIRVLALRSRIDWLDTRRRISG
ncbi:PilZ domain-containing protein [Granulicella sibirica]|uniref:PilZ domain-containing protein n=1 Tax=Granulicella sibirica TaxID=2479048 RepID=UPI001008FA9D|nr:PilZ domain-containing protein [Granulicella sibirica]